MEIKEIKHYFFARRNGITADVLRRSGSGFGMIFGVDVPSISELARSIGKDTALGLRLWDDSNVRESHLLASWLFDPEILTFDQCIMLASSVKDSEDAMMLAFRVLKRRPDAGKILEHLQALQDAGNEDSSVSLSIPALKRHLE